MSHSHMVEGPKPHTVSVWFYWGVFGALLFLTVLTVLVAEYDFGSLSTVVALLVAGMKASLVCAFFMHLWFDNKFYTLVLCSTLVFLSLFLLFPILDEESRAFVDPERANFLPREQQVLEYELQNPGALPLRPGLQTPKKEELNFEAPHGHE